jgi:predicted NBD/HSP70 family sugar kinase
MTPKKVPIGSDLKKANRNNIYTLIWREKRISKQSIMQRLGLSLPTVTQNLNELMREGLVAVNGSFGNTGGRSASGYSIVPQARFAIGVDINKTRIAAVVCDLNGDIIANLNDQCKFEDTPAYHNHVRDHVIHIAEKVPVKSDTLLGVGISIQGLVSQDHQEVMYGPILGITGLKVHQYTNYSPCNLFHDADCGAFAELWVSDDIRNAVYLSLNVNLGSSLIFDRKIFTGDNFMACKAEHMTLIPDGGLCYCGEKGCADVYCRTEVLTDITADGTLAGFFEMLKNGNKKAAAQWDTYLNHLASLLNSLHMILDCNILLGGQLAQYIEPYLDELKRRAYRRNSVDKSQDYIRKAKFSGEAMAAGAALYYIDEFVKNV